MARIFVTALSAVSIIAVGIVALHYRAQALAGDSLGANETEALNLLNNVSGDGLAIMGNALPRLFVVVLFVVIVALFLLVNR